MCVCICIVQGLGKLSRICLPVLAERLGKPVPLNLNLLTAVPPHTCMRLFVFRRRFSPVYFGPDTLPCPPSSDRVAFDPGVNITRLFFVCVCACGGCLKISPIAILVTPCQSADRLDGSILSIRTRTLLARLLILLYRESLSCSNLSLVIASGQMRPAGAQ